MTRPVSQGEPQKAVEARRVGAGGTSGAGGGEFTYSVLPDPAAVSATNGDRRRSPRQRTRLRSGKLAKTNGDFVTECLIYDLSARGCRVRLPRGAALPRVIELFDDQSGLLHRCSILWRDGSDVGVRFEAHAQPEQAREHAEALRRKFYGVRD